MNILENKEARSKVIEMLTKAYWMEVETVISYITNSTNPDGVRAEEIKESLRKDVKEELGHATQFADRIKELYGTVPGSMGFKPEQTYLQPPAETMDLVSVIKGVIAAEKGAIEYYHKIIDFCSENGDPVTADIVTRILADEFSHMRLFEGFLKEYTVAGKA